MAATQTLQIEVDRNFDLLDAFLTSNEFPWRKEDDLASEDDDPVLSEDDDPVLSEEDDPVSESSSSTRPPKQKSSIANYRAGCASPVEAWINEEFGDNEEASHAMHDETDSYTALVRQIGEHIDSVDFGQGPTNSIYDDHVDADVLYSRVDSDDVDMFYEPQLWCFI